MNTESKCIHCGYLPPAEAEICPECGRGKSDRVQSSPAIAAICVGIVPHVAAGVAFSFPRDFGLPTTLPGVISTLVAFAVFPFCAWIVYRDLRRWCLSSTIRDFLVAGYLAAYGTWVIIAFYLFSLD